MNPSTPKNSAKKIPFLDIAHLDEDRRIDMIGHRATAHREIVAFIVEDEAKADRYISKLKAKFPVLGVMHRGPFSENLIVIKVGIVQ